MFLVEFWGIKNPSNKSVNFKAEPEIVKTKIIIS